MMRSDSCRRLIEVNDRKFQGRFPSKRLCCLDTQTRANDIHRLACIRSNADDLGVVGFMRRL